MTQHNSVVDQAANYLRNTVEDCMRCGMNDVQIMCLLHSIEARLDALHREILAIRQAVLPDLTAIIEMHAGKPTDSKQEIAP